MEQTFRPTSKGIFINTLLAALIALALLSLSYYILSIVDKSWLFPALGLCCALFMIVIYVIYIAIQFALEKLIISDEALIYHGLHTTKVFAINEIKNYRQEQFNIKVYSNKVTQEKILISVFYTDIDKIRAWLENNSEPTFLNLSQEEKLDASMKVYEADKQEIMANTEFGKDKDDIEANYRHTKRYANIFNFFAWAIVLWYFFYPTPYQLLTVLVLLLPIIGLTIVYTKKGLVRLFVQEGGMYINLGASIGILPLGLMLRGLLDIELVTYDKVWVATIICSILGTGLVCYVASKELKHYKIGEFLASLVFIGAVVFAYCFYSIVHINTTFDNQHYQVHHTQVIDKRISGSDDEEYYLIIKDSLSGILCEEVKIYEELYENIKKQDSVTIYLKPGILKMPWIRYVEKKE